MPQNPAPTALAAAADVTNAVKAVALATGSAQEDPAQQLSAQITGVACVPS